MKGFSYDDGFNFDLDSMIDFNQYDGVMIDNESQFDV